MCTGRVDLAFILRALIKGADGVLIGGCWPGECHYITEGNYDALGNVNLYRKLLQRIGLSPERLRIEWIAASEGSRFAEVMNSFVGRLRELGPLHGGAGDEASGLATRLEAVNRLIPYIKLVEREKLRVPVKSEAAYKDFFESNETQQLFNEILSDKLAVSQILLLLKENPLSTRAISEKLGLNPSDVSKHMNRSSMHGFVTYDTSSNCYALALGT